MISQSLLMEIVVIPQGDTLGIEVVEALAGLLALRRPKNETSRPKAAGSINLVAGVRNQRYLRLLEGQVPKIAA